MSEPIKIIDDTENSRFMYREDGALAQLAYEVDGDRLILVHTEVPEAIGGRGIAGELVKAAVDRAATSGETIVPWCSYTRKWLQDRADEASRITIDWANSPQR
jgi:predicted GNAT family acetyltransferase